MFSKARKACVILVLTITVVGVMGSQCGAPTPDLTGNAAAGATEFAAACASCHTAAALKPFSGNIVSNLGTLNPVMNGITLMA